MSKHEESRIQEKIVKHFNDLVLHKQLRPCFMYSNRNEDSQNGPKAMRLGAIYNRMGRKKGVPDLTLVYEGRIADIEVKTPSAHRTTKGIERKSRGMIESQIEFHDNYIMPLNLFFLLAALLIFPRFTSSH